MASARFITPASRHFLRLSFHDLHHAFLVDTGAQCTTMPLSAFQQIPPHMRGVSAKASFGAINSVTGHGFTVLDTRLLPVRLGSHTIWVAFSICEEEISILGMDAIARLALSLAGDGCTTLRSSRCAFVKISSDDAAVNLWQPLPKHSATPPRGAAATHSGRNGLPPELAATVATSADVEPYASSPVKITITDADTGVPPIATHCLVEAFGLENIQGGSSGYCLPHGRLLPTPPADGFGYGIQAHHL